MTNFKSYPLYDSSLSKHQAINNLPFDDDIYDSIISKPSNNEKYSPIFRNKTSTSRLIESIHPDLDTYPKLFNNAVELYGSKPCLGARPYNYITHSSENHFKSYTYAEINERKKNLGSGIIHSLAANRYIDANLHSHRLILNHLRDWSRYGSKGFSGVLNTHQQIEQNTSFILSIFSANRLEWILTDLSCSAYSITNTALYDTLGPEVTKYILELTASPIVVCSIDKIETILKLKAEFGKELENIIQIVSMDPIEYLPTNLITQAKQLNIEIHDIFQLEQLGSSKRIQELPPNKDTLYTISFTSGTTGSKPKGAMLSQTNAVTGLSLLASTEPHARGDGSKAFIFLPLTHIYERETSGFALSTGYYLGFPQLTIYKKQIDVFNNLLEDLRVFQPHYFSIVPRILTKFEALIKTLIKDMNDDEQSKVGEIIDWKLSQQAKSDGSTGFNSKFDHYAPYRSIKEFLGLQNVKWLQTASAPVAPSTLIYLKASLSIGMRQLYGLTETFGAITNSNAYECNPGSCGGISPTGEFKLRNVSDMGYNINELKGELLIRGPQVFQGYYHNLEETKNVFDDEEWFHTGDIARIDPQTGRVYIIDRVKNFFKLQQGEYISPEKIENRYLSSNPLIAQLYVHGDSLKNYVVGIVGVEFDKGLKFLNDQCGYNKLDITHDELLFELNKVDIKKKFLRHINESVKDKLNGYEKLHNIHIEINPLTVEREVVTPTFKIRRGVASKFFSTVFHRLYELEQSLLDDMKYLKSKL
ncbi:long-chain-fatty-acid--CoA ligase [Scheffersomyces coipomensis]|uniref:long-chain-fatty-acid--CoA ligase n=1 Tax=Scheffersomyces coipomensis TaxID=1788519 RepID=UPI00315CA745